MYGSSRLGKSRVQVVAATATGFTTRFGTETYQIRVETNQPGGVWLAMFDSTAPTTDFVAGTSTSTTPIQGTLLSAGEWDYFTVTPGQFLCWKSTSTSTAYLSVTEMG